MINLRFLKFNFFRFSGFALVLLLAGPAAMAGVRCSVGGQVGNQPFGGYCDDDADSYGLSCSWGGMENGSATWTLYDANNNPLQSGNYTFFGQSKCETARTTYEAAQNAAIQQQDTSVIGRFTNCQNKLSTPTPILNPNDPGSTAFNSPQAYFSAKLSNLFCSKNSSDDFVNCAQTLEIWGRASPKESGYACLLAPSDVFSSCVTSLVSHGTGHNDAIATCLNLYQLSQSNDVSMTSPGQSSTKTTSTNSKFADAVTGSSGGADVFKTSLNAPII